jgi:TetR/AcrR family transcriptional repressor of mexCD-oprJ operon
MDGRRALAERNVEAILDAAERVLARHEPLNMSSVAAEAGLSRPTVYAHFDDRRALLSAAVDRAVRRWVEAVEAVEPDRGPADEALRRLIEIGWEELSRSAHVADAAAAELSAEARAAGHVSGHEVLERLIARGRADGSFRADVPADWLVSAFFALAHAARDDVAAGTLDPRAALQALLATLPGVFAPPR